MDRKVALGILTCTFLFTALFLATALSTVLTRATQSDEALESAHALSSTALDAARPEVAANNTKPATESTAKPTPTTPTTPMPMPNWIWSQKSATADEAIVLTKAFTLGTSIREARFAMSVDNRARALLDGREIAKSDAWETGAEAEIGELAAGDHTLVIEASNAGGVAAACAYLDFVRADGTRGRLITDSNWEWKSAASSAAQPAVVIARYGDAPWGAVLGGVDDTPRADIDRSITAAPGFIVEPVFVATAARGSIVSMAADGRGRLIVSPQYGKAFAITPCKDGAPAAESTIDPIKPDIGNAHGLLVVDNDLFVVVSRGGPDEQGIWRLRDLNRDGQYDEKKLLSTVARDGGEHGPHQIVLAPDGSLWIVGGNHCAPPDAALKHSRLPRIWQEDIAADRLWDPNGHAVGVMAPGGWVVRTDREGAKWELMTAGFRNSYDLAFDEIGRAFTFDSDMEWDMGLPWYRPTRICELASGVDFGWRSGSGKWPAWSPDSMTAAVDVGPASPTGMLSTVGLPFPAPWNRALLALDWTYGTIWGAWPTDDSLEASSPKLHLQPFVVGRPLPVTDAVTMGDAIYFAVGGRNLPSAIYRVRAEQPVLIKRPPMAVPAALVERRALETLHAPLQGAQATQAVGRAWKALASNDEGVRSAARIALEHQSPALWRARAIAPADPRVSILGLVALCRTGDAAVDAAPVAARLVALEPSVRGTPLEKSWLRACELWLLRFSNNNTLPAGADAVRAAVLVHFPAKEGDLDRVDIDLHRVMVLAKLGAPEAVVGALAILERPDLAAPPKIDAALLARGGPYGKAVSDIMANAPATERIGIAYALRNATQGWSSDSRQRFAHALSSLGHAQGGNSFRGFLARINEEFLSHAPEAEREALGSTIAGRVRGEDAVAPRGPGRAWTTASILALAPKLAAGRDFNEGLRAYRAAQCAQCHRAGGIGLSGGPDLSGVSRRFSVEDLATAIAEPSRTVSDQYQNTDIVLKDGRVLSGRIVGDSADAIELRQSLLSDARDRIAKSDIASRRPSPLSPMPAHVVDALSEGEMLDLLAFLRAGGDAGDPAFLRADDENYTVLFNGTSLAGFTFDPRFWALESGQLVGRTTAAAPAPHNTFFVWDGEVSDFELEVEMMVVGNNSGIQYRSAVYDGVRMRGPQIDAHPAPNYAAMVYEEGGRGILAEHGHRTDINAAGARVDSALAGAAPSPDIAQWRTYRVVAKAGLMEHFLDGTPTATLNDLSNETPSGTRIGIQIHAGEPTEVRVRSVRLRRLDR